MSFTPYDSPPQENKGKWFRSHLLGREIELGELYSLGSNDLDLLMAETAEIRRIENVMMAQISVQ